MITTSSLMHPSFKTGQNRQSRIIGRRRLSVTGRSARVVMAAALIATALLAGGCSTLRLAYGQGPTLAYWWLDRYADFSAEQAPRVRAALAQAFSWHRREHLAEDVALLDQAAREAQKDVTPAQACAWWDKLEKKRDTYLAQAAPTLAEIGPTLTPMQWQHIQQRFDKTNSDWRDEHLSADPREREQATVERVVDRAEMLYGRLDSRQREFVSGWMQRSPWDAQRWLDERQADQRDTLATLRELAQPGGTAAQRAELSRAWLARVAQPSTEALRVQRARLVESQCAFAAELHNRSSPAQRQKAGAALRGWADDLRSQLPGPALSAVGSTPP
jgi:hypothetical protein